MESWPINLTIFFEAIIFIVLILITKKIIWPPLLKAIEDREQIIADGLAASELGKQQLSASRLVNQEDLKKAKLKANEIINLANQTATKIINDTKEQCFNEGKQLFKEEQEYLLKEIPKLAIQLEQDVQVLSQLCVEKILNRKSKSS